MDMIHGLGLPVQECVILNLKFVFCKKHFQFVVPWPLLPGDLCIAMFLVTQPSRRQEHKENAKLKFAALIASSNLHC